MRKVHSLPMDIKKYGKWFFAFLLIFLLNQSASGSQRILLLDDLGRFVELPRPAVRIVCMSDAHAENLVSVRAVKQIVGVGETADPKWIPRAVPRLPRPPKLEEIKALKPDLVLLDTLWASENSAFVGALSASGLPFAVFGAPTLDTFGDYLERFSRLTGRTRDAEQAYAVMMKALRKTEVRSARTDDPKVLLIAGRDYATVPKNSWAMHLVAASGGVPLEKDGLLQTPDSPWFAACGIEQIQAMAKEADVILTLQNTGRTRTASLSREAILADARLKNIPAVKNGRVWEADAATLMQPSLVRLDSSLKECWNLVRSVSKQ